MEKESWEEEKNEIANELFERLPSNIDRKTIFNWLKTRMESFIANLLEEERAIKFASTYKSSQSYLRGFEDGKRETEDFYMNQTANEHDNLIREEERNKWKLKNAGLYRQLFGELRRGEVYTTEHIWEILNGYCPLFTPEQLEDIKKVVTDPFKK